jgi:hypothetical protein
LNISVGIWIFKYVQRVLARDHSSITSSKEGGWGQNMAIFDDLQYCKSSKRWVVGSKNVKNMMT